MQYRLEIISKLAPYSFMTTHALGNMTAFIVICK